MNLPVWIRSHCYRNAMAKTNQTRIVTPRIVQPGEGGGRSWLWLLLLAGLGVWTWQVFEFGQQRAGLNTGERNEIEETLRERVAELEEERDTLRQEAARFERANQIDRASVDGVQSEVKALQAERAELKREVAFLKTLVSGGSQKLALDDHRLVAVEEGTYRFEVTLSKRTEEGDVVSGQVIVRLQGREDGQDKILGMSVITGGARDNIGIKFKNFQKLKTEIKVPQGFEPVAVQVTVKPEGKLFKTFEQTYDWIVSDA